MAGKRDTENDALQELLGKMPGWTASWGSTVVFLLLILLVSGSWVIHYPEIIRSRLVIITKNPPSAVIAKKDGRLEKIFVQNKQRVKKGDYLALIENPADFNDVIKLRTLLDSIKDIVLYPDSVQFVDFQENLTLGELQYPFSAFLKAYHSFRSFNQLNYSQRLTLSLNLQIMDYNSQITQQGKKISLLQDELRLAQSQKERNKILFDKGIISKSAYEKFESAVTEKQIAIEEAQSQINNLRLRISELEQRKLDLDISGKENKNQYFTELITAYQNLTGEIDKWMMNYVLTAPVDGTITFTTYWHENQNVASGKAVFNIVPEGKEELMGKLVIPMKGAGKVKQGQTVNVKFDSYPFTEYGIVRGKIDNISLVPEESVYIAEVHFPQGLKTTFKKELPLKQEMTGMAEIITEDLSLFERLFYPVRSFLKEKINI